MEEVGESDGNWFDGSGEELVNELLDDESPLFISPETPTIDPEVPELVDHRNSFINKLISTVYSGPTIGDIESALSISFRSGDSDGRSGTRPIVSIPEKGLSKMENKYTLKIKSCGSGLADDGYKWRKYGQKSIKNSPNPRSYYRCTNPRCNAKKQVERSVEDPEMLVVTYEGLHLHYAYSHFLLPRPPQHDYSSSGDAAGGPHVAKKPRFQSPEVIPEVEPLTQSTVVGEQLHEVVGEESPQQSAVKDSILELEDAMESPQGLLEDVVPLMVRKPCSSNTSSNEAYYSSQASSPSHSSFSWPASSSILDGFLLSSII